MNLAALVDVAGDEEYEQSRIIDFEAQGPLNAAPVMLESLRRAEFLMRRVSDGDHRALENLRNAADQAHAAISLPIASRSICTPVATGNRVHTAQAPVRFAIDHETAADSDRVHVLVHGKFDVAIIRTDDGVVVDVYPKDGFETVATTYAFDGDVEQE